MDTNYNIEEALGKRRPTLTVGGKEYQFVDLPARQRILKELEYERIEGEITAMADGPNLTVKEGDDPLTAEIIEEATAAHLEEFERKSEKYQVLGVSLMLKDVPRETAAAFTERQMAMARNAYMHWRNTDIPAEEMLGKPSVVDGNSKEE